MEGTDWIFNLEDRIFTILKTKGTKALKEKYPNIKFTTSEMASGVQSFPTIYIHEIPGFEVGQDLEGKDVNGVYYQMMVEVYGNTTKADVKEVTQVVTSILKEMMFKINQFPQNANLGTTYREVLTVSRYIGQSDKF